MFWLRDVAGCGQSFCAYSNRRWKLPIHRARAWFPLSRHTYYIMDLDKQRNEPKERPNRLSHFHQFCFPVESSIFFFFQRRPKVTEIIAMRSHANWLRKWKKIECNWNGWKIISRFSTSICISHHQQRQQFYCLFCSKPPEGDLYSKFTFKNCLEMINLLLRILSDNHFQFHRQQIRLSISIYNNAGGQTQRKRKKSAALQEKKNINFYEQKGCPNVDLVSPFFFLSFFLLPSTIWSAPLLVNWTPGPSDRMRLDAHKSNLKIIIMVNLVSTAKKCL